MALALITGCTHTAPEFKTVRQQGTNVMTLEKVALPNRISPAWLQAPTNFYTLGPGDKLELELLGDPTSKTATVVGPDGKIYFNLLPGTDVWGLTLSEAKAQLEKGLAQYVREQPQVSLVLRGIESKRVWVLGRVHAPGVYGMTTPLTLLEAIAMAGGTLNRAAFVSQDASGISEELADLPRSFVMRQGKLLPVDFERLLLKGDSSQNIYLQPDDFVYFPTTTAREVYVLGAVTQPRPIPYRKGLTVSAAIASAYGTLTGAYLYHVAVVRGSLSQPQIAIVNYRAVIRGEAPDVELEPRDIVYVPFAPYRYLVRYAQLVLDTFVASSAINAGSAIVTTQPTGGAGIFIPVGSGIQVIPPVTPPPIR